MSSPDARSHSELRDLVDAARQTLVEESGIREVLRAQVEGAIATSELMATQVVEEARTTLASATDLSEFMALHSEKVERVFARVATAIDSTDSVERLVLEERARSLAKAGQNSHKIMAEQRRLEGLGEQAHGLGMRVRIVALNTMIEAKRGAGNTGTTIGVLANEISSLAVEVQRLGLELKDSLHDLSAHLRRDLVDGIRAEAQALDAVRTTLAAQVSELRLSCAELDQLRLSVWNEVSRSSKQIAAVASAMSGVQYQDILRQRLSQVTQVLVALTERDEVLLQALRGEAALPADWSPLTADVLRRQYVMGAQRAVHDAQQGSAIANSESQLPEIDLF